MKKRNPAADPSDSDQSFDSKLPETLVKDITKSAKKGDIEAQYNLGLMYENGRGVPQDYKQAVHWLTKSAEQGYARTQFHFGGMYAKGKGAPQDDKQAVDWYPKSAEQGHAWAQYNLGLMYYEGGQCPARLSESH